MKPLIYYGVIIITFITVFVGYSFTLKPFSFKLNSLWEFFGWILIFMGIVIITTSQSRQNYKQGYETALKDLIEYEKNIKQKNK